MSQKPEVELVAQGKQGDHTAISELFHRHYASSLRLARRILPWDESQDAVQAAYISAFQHFDGFRGDASFKTWIGRIVVNCCLLRLREPERKVGWVHLDDLLSGPPPRIPASPGPTPEEATWLTEITSAVTGAVSRLPKHLGDVFTLHSISGLSLQDAAAALGLTVPAAKARLFRARAKLRLLLQAMRPVNMAGFPPSRGPELESRVASTR